MLEGRLKKQHKQILRDKSQFEYIPWKYEDPYYKGTKELKGINTGKYFDQFQRNAEDTSLFTFEVGTCPKLSKKTALKLKTLERINNKRFPTIHSFANRKNYYNKRNNSNDYYNLQDEKSLLPFISFVLSHLII